MELAALYNKLEQDDTYQSWLSNNNNSYLTHFFLIHDNKPKNWQIGFYDSTSEVMSVFTINSTITIDENKEVFKREKTKIQELKLNQIKIQPDQALEIAKKFQQLKHSAHSPTKIIMILQNLEKHNETWNLTFITQTLSTLNIKIDAKNGKIISNKLTSLMDFKK